MAFLLAELITWGNTPLMVIGIVVNIWSGRISGKVRAGSAEDQERACWRSRKGNVNYKIPLDGLRGETLEIAQTINRLGEGPEPGAGEECAG